MEINNREQIESLLSFPSEDTFYYAVILKRKKEHPKLGSNSYVVKNYFIKSLDDLEFYWSEMVVLAKTHNARVCINLNKRSFEAMALQTMKKVADQIMNKDFKSVRKAYTSVCGAYNQDKNKKWIIDVDYKDQAWIDTLKEKIESCQPYDKEKVITTLETKNGYHVITNPFNVAEFQLHLRELAENDLVSFDDPDIQKNNPTILYIP